MIFLLTNDDGIKSDRLQFTKNVLEKYGTVYLVAPKTEQSAKSMSLSIGGFEYEKIDEFTYSIEGTPVDCVNFAFGALELKPDIVVSGTNQGYNIGVDVRYSGTVGACLQAQYFGVNTIAFSADRAGDVVMKSELEKTLKHILDNNMTSSNYTLNVNFPRDKFEQSKGILETEVDYYQYDYCPELTDTHYKPNRSFIVDFNLKENTDIYAYAKGYTSITKIKV
jgi:5'-nucleotidase